MVRNIAECLPVIGASRSDVENWLRHQDLRTKYEPTSAGKARSFSRENVEELAVTAAFVRVGFRPSSGIAMAYSANLHRQNGHLREWIIMAAGDNTSGTWTDKIRTEHIEAATSGSIASAHIVRIGEIFRRVEALFSAASGEAGQ